MAASGLIVGGDSGDVCDGPDLMSSHFGDEEPLIIRAWNDPGRSMAKGLTTPVKEVIAHHSVAHDLVLDAPLTSLTHRSRGGPVPVGFDVGDEPGQQLLVLCPVRQPDLLLSPQLGQEPLASRLNGMLAMLHVHWKAVGSHVHDEADEGRPEWPGP